MYGGAEPFPNLKATTEAQPRFQGFGVVLAAEKEPQNFIRLPL
jgi:hypothetical protein